jgi:cbb3-type cytochrome oxidase subunit 1
MARLDIKFLLLAAVALAIGVGMGIYMGIAHDFSLAPVHAHMNLVGWVSLALFGVTYKLYPQLQERWPARLHFTLAAPAAILFPIGIYLSINHGQPLLAIAASLVWAAGVLLFLGQLAALAFAGGEGGAVAVPAE